MPFIIIWMLLGTQSISASPIETCNGKVFRWPISAASPTLYYYVDSSLDSTLARYARSAATIWSSVSTSYLRLVETTTSSSANFTIQADSTGIVSYASPSYDSACEISSCTVHLKPNMDVGDTSNYPYSTTIHEMGHCLGLNHSIMNNAIMSYRSNNPISLGGDDGFALSLLYPSDQNPIYPAGCATLERSEKKGTNRKEKDTRTPETLLLFVCIGFIYGAFRFRKSSAK